MVRAVLAVHLALLLIAGRGDEWGGFREEDYEEENLDDEVDFPGGEPPEPQPRTSADVPQAPFTFQVFEPARMSWRDPLHDDERRKAVSSQMEAAWEHAVSQDLEESSRKGQHTDKRVYAGNIIQ